MNRFNFTLTAVALGFAIAATPALAAKDYWVNADDANKTFNEHTKATNNRNAKEFRGPQDKTPRKVGFKQEPQPLKKNTPGKSTTASRAFSSQAAGTKKPRISSSTRKGTKVAQSTQNATRKGSNAAKSVQSAGATHRNTARSGAGRTTKSMRRVNKGSGSTRVAGAGSSLKKVKKVKNVRNVAKGAKTAKQIKAGAGVLKSTSSAGKAIPGVGIAMTVVGAGLLGAELYEQEKNDPGKTWRDIKSGNIAKSTVYDTVDLAPGGFLITGTAKIIDQEATDPGKTMRDIDSGLNTFAAKVDRAGLGMNRVLGLSTNPGDAHVLNYVTPVGAGLAIGRSLKSGRIQSDLRKTGADIKKVGTDIDRHANGVKNDVKKATANVGKKVDGVFKGIFK